MRIAVYPGSFDPVTLGHMDIISRSSKLFDKLIVGVLVNSSKVPLFSAEERVNMIKGVVSEYANVEVRSFDGLLVEFARLCKATAVVRGLMYGMGAFGLRKQTHMSMSEAKVYIERYIGKIIFQLKIRKSYRKKHIHSNNYQVNFASGI